MPVTTGKTSCPRCGLLLPGGRWGDTCPACLSRVSLASMCRLLTPKRQVSAAAGSGEPSAAAGQPVSSPHPPGRWGDYELIEEVARGGMGVVWRARQSKLNRLVAVKLLRAGEFARPEEVERFRVEAAAVASLQHPQIVALHDFGEHQGQPWISMDYIEGRTLAESTHDGPLPPRRAAELLKMIAEAVAYAHARGILHRDIKPSNILLDGQGLPRITDFGLAKRLPEATPGVSTPELTRTGQMLGTPNYAPPEQLALALGPLGPPSDVYGLGAVLYEMLTGRPPFAAATLEATLLRVIDADPVSPRLLNPSVPVDLETICLKCLEKRPDLRYGTAQGLVHDLARFLRGEPVLARPVGLLGQLGRWCRRKPGWAMAAALASVLMTTFGTLTTLTWLSQAEKERVEAAISSSGLAVPVRLQKPTATFSQAGFPVSAAIDADTVAGGWAIRESTGSDDPTHAQSAVFETATDVGYPGGSLLTFKLVQNGGQQHTIGRFRLAVTTDDRGSFADGSTRGGDVTAGWTLLHPTLVSAASGIALHRLEDGSVVSSGVAANVDTYTITAPTSLNGITGVRLEVLPYPHQLPFHGPGNHQPDGNFILTEFEVTLSSVNAIGTPLSRTSDAAPVRLEIRFMESDFQDSVWELHAWAEPPSARASIARIVETPHGTRTRLTLQRTTHRLGGSDPESELLSVVLNTTESYDPALQGEIAFLDWSVDTRTALTEFNTYGGHLAPALKQGNRYFVAKMFFQPTRDNHENPRLPSPWKEMRHPRLRSQDFLLLIGASRVEAQHPDFSSNAPPITFGYALRSTHTSAELVVREVDVDNWSVAVYSRPPSQGR